VGVGLSGLSPLTLSLSVFVVAAILLGRWLVPKVPVPLFVVVGMIAASAGFHLADHGVAVIGPVPGGLPSLRWPDVTWSETLALLPVSASCFVMIIAQSAATSRVYGIKHQERVDENADILGLAAANAGAALTGAFVVNGSPTQTAMADNAGAKSQIAQLVFVGVVVVVLLALTGFLQDLPRCVLAAIVFTIAIHMIDVKGLSDILSESRGEFLLALATAAAVPGVGVEEGILLAIALSLIRHVRHSYRPNATIIRENDQGHWVVTPALPGAESEPGLIIYRFGADIFYANADRFADEARALVAGAPTPVKWFIVDASAVTDVDYSAARTLRDLFSEFKAKNVNVAFGRCDPGLRADLERHGLVAIVGEGRILSSLHSALALADGGTEKPRSIAG
jgi:MFS superfamily sulfate permease-like transporter